MATTQRTSRGESVTEDLADEYITADLLDAGETYGALAKTDADAVIHMGTIPRPPNHPEHITYESNVMTAVNVLEAAQNLGLESVCLASSINAIGSAHQQAAADIRYLPLDEAHLRTPQDPYGIAKHCMEVTADGFGRRAYNDLSISSLRYPWVMTDEELHEMLIKADRTLEGLETASPTTPEMSYSPIFISRMQQKLLGLLLRRTSRVTRSSGPLPATRLQMSRMTD